MSSVSAISTLAGGQLASAAANLSDQIAQELQVLLTALQSGDTSGAKDALTTLQTLLRVSDPSSTFVTRNPQVLVDFAKMDQALDSGDPVAPHTAFTALQKDVTNLVMSVMARGVPLQGTAAPRIQELGSADSITLSSASVVIHKELVSPAPAASPADSATSLAYVTNSVGTLPATHSSFSNTAIEEEAGLSASRTAQEAAKIAAQVNTWSFLDIEAHGNMYLTALFFIVIVLVLFLLL